MPKRTLHAVSFVSCFATCPYILKITNPRELKETASPIQQSSFLADSQGFMLLRVAISIVVAPFRERMREEMLNHKLHLRPKK